MSKLLAGAALLGAMVLTGGRGAQSLQVAHESSPHRAWAPAPAKTTKTTAGIATPNDLVARGKHGVVVCQEPHATAVGLAVLQSGGNAVDAAVAVALTLAVTFPQAGNLGGGGFMVLRTAGGEVATIDFRERAPK